jgi:uncharacterized protein YkwD
MPATPTAEFSITRNVRRRLAVAAAALAVTAGSVVVATAAADTTVEAAPSENDWLGVVNAYRAASGLPPVVENSAWSSGGRNHSCWMLLNGIAHDEQPGTAGYTADGDAAGNSGNVAVSSNAATTARSHVELWMSGPFHAVGILRSSLRQAGYGMCASPPNPTNTQWRSAATLDVVRGIDGAAPKPTSPVFFPGNGATTSLTRFVAESPDPRTFCGWSGQSVGLPLIALMPSAHNGAVATLDGPNGPIPTCVLTRSNTSGVASSILGGDNALVVIPAAPLAPGSYRVAALTDNGQGANWSFTVDPNAPLTGDSASAPTAGPLGTTAALGAPTPFEPVTPFRLADSRGQLGLTRLTANQQVRVRIAGQGGLPSDMSAVSANFTVDRTSAAGYLTASNCTEANPSVSTLNFEVGDSVPNQAIIPLDRGDICLFASADTDVIIDVNGYVAPGASQVLIPVAPRRMLDTRSGQPLQPGSVLRVDVEGGSSPAPDAAVAVAVNLTGTGTTENGWVRAFPCGVAEPGVSSINPRAGRDRANSAIVPTGADGTICLTSNITTHVIIDITGWFGEQSGQRFVPVTPIRLTDTRSAHPDLNGGRGARLLEPGQELRVQVAGSRGITADARAVTLNLVATDGPAGGWLRAVPCGGATDVSNLNFPGIAAVANGANVMLDGQGAVCVTTSAATHVLVDVTGVWS